MSGKLNGILKWVGISASSILVIFALMLGMIRHSQTQMTTFTREYNGRLRTVENIVIRLETKLDGVIKSLNRIEGNIIP